MIKKGIRALFSVDSQMLDPIEIRIKMMAVITIMVLSVCLKKSDTKLAPPIAIMKAPIIIICYTQMHD